MQAFLESAPDGHRLADAFHLRGERGVGQRKFLEGEARNLGDDVINVRLVARGGFVRDVVLENPRNRKTPPVSGEAFF